MPDEITPREERRGTRKVMLWAAVIAVVALIVTTAWPLLHKSVTGQQQQGPAEQVKR